MATHLVRPTNGVSFGVSHTVTAQDATDDQVLLDFQVDYPLSAVVQVLDASGVVVDISDAVITYPADGQVSIEDGAATYVVTATDVVHVVANRRYA